MSNLIRRPNAPAAPPSYAPPKPPSVGAGAAWGVASIGWLVALVLLVLLVQAKGCSVPWVGVNAGPRNIVILRESAEDTPATARLWTALRNPPHSDYLTSKGHKLLILDDDQTPEWAEALNGVKFPAMAISDPASKKILDRRTVDVEAGAAGVIAAIKAKGG